MEKATAQEAQQALIRVLDIGCGDGTHADWFADRGPLDVVRLDADPDNKPDVVHDILMPLPNNLTAAFDIVIASHVLEHVPYRDAMAALKHIVSGAVPGGEVRVYVPSMEWAAQEILAGRETFGLLGLIWGGQSDPWDNHYCGFTRRSLAAAMYQVGCVDVKVGESGIIVVIDGKQYDAKQVVAVGKAP